MIRSLLLCALCIPATLQADVVKPTMIDISVHADGRAALELHVSIEALMTGINNRFRNTKDAPQAKAYDALRALPAPELAKRFEPFKQKLLEGISLEFDGKQVSLSITEVEIPEPGYQKIPRASVVYLEGEIPRGSSYLTWYFPKRFSDNAVRVQQVDDVRRQWRWSNWVWLRDDLPSEPFPIEENFVKKPLLQVVASYVRLGYDHIVPIGLDHILFVVGIFLLTARFRPLLSQVTMFTLAHSISLALAVYGLVELPARIVEPLVALSIAYIGVENLYSHKVQKRRLLLVFGFGLLHGLGFAGALKEFGMPPGDYVTALVSFNLGVELGQIAIVLAAFALFAGWFARKTWYRSAVVLPVSGLISVLGLTWTVDRLMG
ncbi:MAG TPA: HupE/UreJ family protein [Chromatiales bacterium]|nr:HupE/UreJ family protein [Chromatiales bacterium]